MINIQNGNHFTLLDNIVSVFVVEMDDVEPYLTISSSIVNASFAPSQVSLVSVGTKFKVL